MDHERLTPSYPASVNTRIQLTQRNCKNMNFFCHVSTETAADDPSKSAKRAKRGNAGSVHSLKTAVVHSATIFLELFSSTWVKELTQHCESNLSVYAHRSEESLRSQRGQKAEQEGRVIRGEVSVLSGKHDGLPLDLYTYVHDLISLHFSHSSCSSSFLFSLQWWRKCSRVSFPGASLTESKDRSSRENKAGPQHPYQPGGQCVIDVG